MRTTIAAATALCLTSGCVADGLSTTRTYRTNPRSEARWIVTGGLGEALLGGAMLAGGLDSIANPEPKDTAEPVDIGDATKELGTAVAFAALGAVLIVVGAGDTLGGLYQLVSNDFLIGEAFE